jgi:hypothetical protein
MTIAVGIEQPEAEIIEICRRHSVSELLGVSAMMRELSALLGRRNRASASTGNHGCSNRRE